MKSLAIFKPGAFTAMSGEILHFSKDDLKEMVSCYNPQKHAAPLVLFHPSGNGNGTAYGHAQSLLFTGGMLKAISNNVSQEFSEWANAKRYKKISASFYLPGSHNNPEPGVYYLRHIGFLGAMPPSIKGLPYAECTDNAADSISYSFPAESNAVSPTQLAARASVFQAEMRQRGETIDYDEAVIAVDAGITSPGEVSFSELFDKKHLAFLMPRLYRARHYKNA